MDNHNVSKSYNRENTFKENLRLYQQIDSGNKLSIRASCLFTTTNRKIHEQTTNSEFRTAPASSYRNQQKQDNLEKENLALKFMLTL